MLNEVVEIRKANDDDRMPLFRRLEFYQHDLSDIWDQDLDRHGEYGYLLDKFWLQEDCHAYVALFDGKYAGFALVTRTSKVNPRQAFWMDQFFVLKKYRRKGVGRILASDVFRRNPGAWEVGQMPGNGGAVAFWRNVVGEVSEGAYIEKYLSGRGWEGSVQCFKPTIHSLATSGPTLQRDVGV